MENNKENVFNIVLAILLCVTNIILGIFLPEKAAILLTGECIIGVITFFILVGEDELKIKGKIIRSVINFIVMILIISAEIFWMRVWTMECIFLEREYIIETMLTRLFVTFILLLITSILLLFIGAKRFFFRKKIDKYIVLNIIICLVASGVAYAILTFARNG